MEATISYKGPATTLTISAPYLTYGSTPGSASKFFVIHPPSPSPLPANGKITLIVQFQVPLDDFNFYKAGLQVGAGSATPVEVIVKGNRNPF